MFTSLVKVEGELRLPRTSQTASAVCRRASNSLALMASVPPPMVTAGLAAEDAARGSYKTSYAVEMAATRFQRDPTDVE